MNTNVDSVKIKKGSTAEFYKKYGLLIVLVLFIILLSIFKPEFVKLNNVLNVLRQISINGFLAIGMTFVILTGGIDLSVGSLTGLAGIFAALFAQQHGLPVIVPIIMGCLSTLIMGFVNGILIAVVRVPAFITTLGMLSMARSVIYFITNGNPVAGLSPEFLSIGKDYWLGVPIPVWMVLVAFIICQVVLVYTKFGRYVYAIGGSEEAAITSGIKVKTLKVAVYSLMGLCAGFAGVILSSRVTSGISTSGLNYELDAIAAVVMGGTSLSGGEGRLWGTAIGLLLLGIINNGLDLFGVSPYLQLLVKGAIIILAVTLDVQTKKKG